MYTYFLHRGESYFISFVLIYHFLGRKYSRSPFSLKYYQFGQYNMNNIYICIILTSLDILRQNIYTFFIVKAKKSTYLYTQTSCLKLLLYSFSQVICLNINNLYGLCTLSHVILTSESILNTIYMSIYIFIFMSMLI